MFVRSKLFVVSCSALTLLATGCGEPEQAPPPQEYCEAENVNAYARGSIGAFNLNLERSTITGSTIIGQQVMLKLGDVARKKQGDKVPLLMRIYDNEIKSELIDAMANAIQDGPQTLTVVDASQGIDGSEQTRTDLSSFDCSIKNGTICVQIGFDTNGDGQLLNDDDAAFNASAGTVTLKTAQSAKFNLTWDIELGKNLLTHADTSSGKFTGCIRSRYETAGLGNWQLR